MLFREGDPPRTRRTSRFGGALNSRPHSRVNCETLSDASLPPPRPLHHARSQACAGGASLAAHGSPPPRGRTRIVGGRATVARMSAAKSGDRSCCTKDHAFKLSSSSLPGLTRQSIVLKILGFFKMDARVKPAHDESIIARMSIIRPP
jgi:hypothetical protein